MGDRQSILEMVSNLRGNAEARTDGWETVVVADANVPPHVRSLMRQGHNTGYLQCLQDVVAYLKSAEAPNG